MSFVDRPGGTALNGTEDDPAQPGAQLTLSPGRIEPQNSVWEDSRKPLAGEFVFDDRRLFVVANHFASKGGDAPLFGRFQEPYRPSELQRRGQARVVNGWVERLLAADKQARVVVLGDLNDFEFSETANVLQRGAPGSEYELTDLWQMVPGAQPLLVRLRGQRSGARPHPGVARAARPASGLRSGPHERGVCRRSRATMTRRSPASG